MPHAVYIDFQGGKFVATFYDRDQGVNLIWSDYEYAPLLRKIARHFDGCFYRTFLTETCPRA